MSKLYPHFKLRGTRKAWDHCSMDCSSTGNLLRRRYGVPADYGDPAEAVGWFEGDDDALRALVADFSNGKRVILRRNSRHFTLTFTRAA